MKYLQSPYDSMFRSNQGKLPLCVFCMKILCFRLVRLLFRMTTKSQMELIWAQVDEHQKIQNTKEDTSRFHICVCGSAKVFEYGQLPTCHECGRVDDSFLSDEPEWNSGMDGDGTVTDASRCGVSVDHDLFSDKWGLGTLMNTYGQSYQIKKLARISFHSSMNHKDRALYHTYKEFDEVKDALGVNDVIIHVAKTTYKKFSECKLTRGNVRTGIKANCVFFACKEHGYPRTTKEVADAFGIDTHDMGRTTELFYEVSDTQATKVTKPRDIVARIINHIDLGDNRKVYQRKILEGCNKMEMCTKLMGKTPSGVASALVYIILTREGFNISKHDVCRAADVSIPTLNKIENIVRTEMA